MNVIKLGTVFTLALAIGEHADARQLRCQVYDTLNQNEGNPQVVLEIQDDRGSLTSGGFTGLLSKCELTDKDYEYYYGEYFRTAVKCSDGSKVVLHASNSSDDVAKQENAFYGRFVKMNTEGKQAAVPIMCHDK